MMSCVLINVLFYNRAPFLIFERDKKNNELGCRLQTVSSDRLHEIEKICPIVQAIETVS